MSESEGRWRGMQASSTYVCMHMHESHEKEQGDA